MNGRNGIEIDEQMFLTDSFFRNPYPYYRLIQNKDHVHWNEKYKMWLVTRYQDVTDALRDPHLSVQRSPLAPLPHSAQEELQPLASFYRMWLMFSDPPKHDRLRRRVGNAFTPRMVEAMRPDIEARANRLLDALPANGRMELLADFAVPLSILSLMSVVGIDAEHYTRVRAWSTEIVAVLGTSQPDVDLARRAQRNFLELESYFRRLLTARRRDPGGDLLSRALLCGQETGSLSENEIIAMCANILVDGHEPVANLLANGLVALWHNPEQWSSLWQDPRLLDSAVEEMLRYDPPFQYAGRRSLQELEIGGRKIKRNQRVLLVLAAANRDPAYFRDPDRFDISRPHSHHCAFGLGVHFCLGAALGRLIMRVALESLIQRMPGLTVPAQALERQRSLGFRAFRRLYLTW